jgi:hypothetical protein
VRRPAAARERGLTLVVDASSVEYRAKYMWPSGRHMKGFEFYHAAMAKVSGTNKVGKQ